jgi:NAD(P)-dependent dehydrogenase (short-subunit alcohol dehydrogenase family)
MLVRILSQSHLRPRPVQLQYSNSNSNSFQFKIRNLYLHSKSQIQYPCSLLITPSSTPTTTFQNRCFSSNPSNNNNNNHPSNNHNQKTALIIGSSGTLGSSIASQLQKYHNCTIIGCDIHPPSQQRLDCIDAFIPLPDVDTLNSVGNGTDDGGNGTTDGEDGNGGTEITIDSLIDGLQNGIQNLYGENTSNVGFDAIICASGGFAMDDDDDNDDNDDKDTSSNIGKVYQKMFQMNYYPVVASAEIAKKHLHKSPKSSPLFLTIGALAALSPSPNMIAYSTSKQAAHYYIQTMGAMCDNSQTLSKQYKIQRENEMGRDYRRKNMDVLSNMSCIALLPIMIDTELNRQVLKGKVDEKEYGSWTKPVDIAKEIGRWVDTPELRPHSGSLVKVVTNNGETAFTLAR